MNSKTSDTNFPVFLPTCLNCDAPMEEVEDWGGAMQGGSCDCSQCGEQHSYLIENGLLILQRVSVPIGYEDIEVEKIFSHHGGGSSLRSQKPGSDLHQYEQEEDDEILEAISSGQTSLAFMLYREKYGGTAQEAKEFIDDLRGPKGGTKLSAEQDRGMPDWQTIQESFKKSNISKVKTLLKKEPGFLKATDLHGWTPLHMAVQFLKPEIVKLLLASGAEVSARDVKGWTPLHLAAAGGSVEITKLLLAHGAGVAETSNDGNTPVDLAQQALDKCSSSELTLILAEEYSNVLAVLQLADLQSESSNSSEGCFIASACYGSPDCREVNTLRRFRDEGMASSPLGRLLIAAYYWISPPIARLLIRHSGVRGYVRKRILEPVVRWVEGK